MLAQLLARLAEQRLASERFEVVVVDDGSASPGSAPASSGLRLRLLSHPESRGPAAARNTGWRAAHGSLIAFTDDDCLPEPTWLDALLAAWGDDAAVVVQGRTEPVPAERHLMCPLSRTQVVGGPDMLFETCNVAYPRALLELVGGFDEWFKHACGEDVDLGWRAVKAGARLVFSEEALVHHPVHRLGLARLIRHTWRWSDAVRVLAKHPEIRRMMVARVFWKPTHPPLLAALAGGALAVRYRAPLLGAAAGVPYLRLRAGEHRSPRKLARWLPVHVAVDLCELATMLYGSVRHRTLML